MQVLITGGLGFIGSHLVDALVKKKSNLVVLDNCSTGSKENIQTVLKEKPKNVELVEGDCTNAVDVDRALKGVEVVFHLAANPEVRLELSDPRTCFQQNIYAAHVLLQQITTHPRVHTIIFTSTSTVYGEPDEIPTPETYAPMKPISLYGASKLSCEALISAYAHTFDKKAIILRLANTIGPRSQHGVLHDFIQKLRDNPNKLEILGDGTQTKSYLYITDCIKAIETALKTAKNRVEIYNVGSEDQIPVTKIAQIVAEEMELENTDLTYTGGVDGGRGWKGDVKNMLLDTTKLKAKGWSPEHTSEQAIRKTIQHLIA